MEVEEHEDAKKNPVEEYKNPEEVMLSEQDEALVRK